MKQDQDYSVVARALDALNSLTAQDEEIQRLKEQRAQAKKDMIAELGQMLRQAPLDQTFALASDAYWADPLLADVMKKAYVLATGKGLFPRPMPTEVLCKRCGNLITVTSWKGYKDVTSYAEWHQDDDYWHNRQSLCDSCAEARDAENAEKNSTYLKTWEEQCEEESRQREQMLAQFQAMSDDEYFQTEHWQLLAQATVKKSGFRCQLCNAGGVLGVHLRSRECRGCESLVDLVALCRECSGSFHLIEEIRNS